MCGAVVGIVPVPILGEYCYSWWYYYSVIYLVIDMLCLITRYVGRCHFPEKECGNTT